MKRRELPNNLYSGLVLPIYLDTDEGERYEFDAELIEPCKTNWRTHEEYLWSEGRSESSDIYAVKEIWKVRVKSDSPFENGKEFIRHIPRYHSFGLISSQNNEEE